MQKEKNKKQTIICFSDFETTTTKSKQYLEEKHFNVYSWAFLPIIEEEYVYLPTKLENSYDTYLSLVNREDLDEKEQELLEKTKYSQEKENKDVVLKLKENRDGFFTKYRNKTIIGDTLDNYYDFIVDYAFNNNINLLIYFHNLSFDGNYLFKYLLRRKDIIYVQDLDIVDNTQFKKDFKYVNWFSIFETDSNILKIELHLFYKRKMISITFQCTAMLFRQSIEAIGEALGTTKIEQFINVLDDGFVNGVEFSKSNAESFYHIGGKDLINFPKYYNAVMEYMKNDVVIINVFFSNFKKDLMRVVPEFFQFHKKIKHKSGSFYKKDSKNVTITNTLTATGLSSKLALNSCSLARKNKQYISWFTDPFLINENYNIADMCYRGGFTQFNLKYQKQKLKNVSAIDINSSYPTSLFKLLPINGKLYTKEQMLNKKNKENVNFVKWYKIKIEFKIKKEYENTIAIIPKAKRDYSKFKNRRYCEELKIIDNFSIDDKTRYLFNGSGTYYVYCEEFELWNKFYDIKILEKETFYLEADYVFRPFIDKFYYLKENAKSPVEKAIAKLFLNVIYGATAKRLEFNTIYHTLEEKAKYEYFEKQKLKNKQYQDKKWFVETVKENKKYNIDGKELFCYALKTYEDKEKAPNKFIAAQCTAYSRIMLLEAILKIGVHNFVYTDTDSIYFIFDGNNVQDYLINLGFKIDSKKLGYWDIQCEKYDEFIVRGSKNYISTKEGKRTGTIAGVNKKRMSDLLLDDNVYSRYYEENEFLINDASTGKIEDSWGIGLEWIDKVNKLGTI